MKQVAIGSVVFLALGGCSSNDTSTTSTSTATTMVTSMTGAGSGGQGTTTTSGSGGQTTTSTTATGAGGGTACNGIGDSCVNTCSAYGLECQPGVAGESFCVPSQPACGGFANTPCPSMYPTCIYFPGGDYGVCLTPAQAACVCSKNSGLQGC